MATRFDDRRGDTDRHRGSNRRAEAERDHREPEEYRGRRLNRDFDELPFPMPIPPRLPAFGDAYSLFRHSDENARLGLQDNPNLYGVGGTYAGRGPKGYRRSDERIHEDVCEALTRNAAVDASDIDVRVENGEVTLKGQIENRRMKRLAEDLIETISGVHDVHNQLRVRRPEPGAGH